MRNGRSTGATVGAVLAAASVLFHPALAQAAAGFGDVLAAPTIQGPAAAGTAAPPSAVTASVPPADYLIGPDDILSVIFWRDKDMTTDVVVRPDGKISLPVLNELQAAGLTPEQLRVAVLEAATKYMENPAVNVVVKQVNSRKVFVTGEVGKPNFYPLSGPMTVIQLLALAGGLNDFAKKSDVAVIRTENGQSKRYRVNYNDIIKGKNMQQNIMLKAGDVVIVP